MKIEAGSTDEKIVDATFRILQKEGVEKTTTKKIAAEAGVNEVTIFRNFKNKKNLISVVKDYYLNIFIEMLENIFDFDEDEEMDDYLKNNFIELINLPEEKFSIVKIAMEEVREIPDKKLLISTITDAILNKLEEFFTMQREKGNIKDIDPRTIAITCFSITFQSVVLWKTYNNTLDFETEKYGDEFLNILYNGIKP